MEPKREPTPLSGKLKWSVKPTENNDTVPHTIARGFKMSGFVIHVLHWNLIFCVTCFDQEASISIKNRKSVLLPLVQLTYKLWWLWWNELPLHVRTVQSMGAFKGRLKTCLSEVLASALPGLYSYYKKNITCQWNFFRVIVSLAGIYWAGIRTYSLVSTYVSCSA